METPTLPSAGALPPLRASRVPGPVATETQAVPWYIYALMLGMASIVIGAIWDISWHRTIGRDTFWSPPHLAIYLGGVTGGLVGGWLALKASFFPTEGVPAASVRLWGFQAPLGAWVLIWGALAMITSAPFDDWWHNAYGLDVEIISPPHALLALGIVVLQLGALLLVLAHQNRAPEALKQRYAQAYLFVGGVIVLGIYTFLMEESLANFMHNGRFYAVSAAAYPLLLMAVARAAAVRWAATKAAAVYMGLQLLMVWVLPLFEAQPLLGPIYNPVDHMLPPFFPLLLVGPAFTLDLLLQHNPTRAAWRTALYTGTAFLAVFLALQWPFSAFLISPAAENAFFAGSTFGYWIQVGDWTRTFLTNGQTTADLLRGLVLAWGLAILSARLGLGIGNWMTRVQR